MANNAVMERVSTAVICGLLLLVALSPLAAASSAEAMAPSVAQEAWVSALWLEETMEPNRFRMYSAGIIDQRHVASGEIRRLGSVVKGYCRKKPLGNDHYYACNGTGPSVTARDSFEVVADGSSAVLKVRRGDRTWSVRWEASGSITQSGIYTSQEGCSGGQGNGAGIIRRATATGSIFGRKMTTDAKSDLGVTAIWKGNAATTCSPGLSAADLRSLSQGETVYIRAR